MMCRAQVRLGTERTSGTERPPSRAAFSFLFFFSFCYRSHRLALDTYTGHFASLQGAPIFEPASVFVCGPFQDDFLFSGQGVMMGVINAHKRTIDQDQHTAALRLGSTSVCQGWREKRRAQKGASPPVPFSLSACSRPCLVL